MENIFKTIFGCLLLLGLGGGLIFVYFTFCITFKKPKKDYMQFQKEFREFVKEDNNDSK